MRSHLKAFSDWRFPVMLCGYLAAGYAAAVLNAGQPQRDLAVAAVLVGGTCALWLMLGMRKPPSPYAFGALLDLAASAGLALMALQSLLGGSLFYALFWGVLLAVFLHRAAGAFIDERNGIEAGVS